MIHRLKKKYIIMSKVPCSREYLIELATLKVPTGSR
jgi:hypothetical protein